MKFFWPYIILGTINVLLASASFTHGFTVIGVAQCALAGYFFARARHV